MTDILAKYRHLLVSSGKPDCLTFPDGRRMTRAELMAAHASLPPTQTMPPRGGTYPETTDNSCADDRPEFNLDGSARQGMDRPKRFKPEIREQLNGSSVRLTREEIDALDFLTDEEHIKIRAILTGED